MAEGLQAKLRQIEEVDDHDDSGPPLNLDEASANLERMSAELDALLKSIEGEVPSEFLESFNEEELEREGEEAAAEAASANDPALSVAHLEKRMKEATAGVENELRITEELKELQAEIQADNLRRAEDCQRAAAELQELRDAMDAMTGGESECGAELRRMCQAKYSVEESKSDLPPPPPTRAQEEASKLHDDDQKLEDDATPTDEEAQMMIMLLSKMKSPTLRRREPPRENTRAHAATPRRYQSLGVENDELRAQIAELQEMRNGSSLADLGRDMDLGLNAKPQS